MILIDLESRLEKEKSNAQKHLYPKRYVNCKDRYVPKIQEKYISGHQDSITFDSGFFGTGFVPVLSKFAVLRVTIMGDDQDGATIVDYSYDDILIGSLY